MKHHPITTAFVVVFTLGTLASSVLAQPPGAPRPTPGNSQRRQAPPFGNGGFPGQAGPGGPFSMMQRGGRAAVDPTRSAFIPLLRRDDVRNELQITSRQREQLEQIIGKDDMQMTMTLMQQMQNSPDNRQRMERMRERFAELRNLPPQERAARARELMNDPETSRQMRQEVEQMQAQRTAALDDLEAKVTAILTPRQLARLQQLDLQYRWGLALADAKLAEPLALKPEQKTQVEQLLEGYRAKQTEGIGAFFPGARRPNNREDDEKSRMADMLAPLRGGKPQEPSDNSENKTPQPPRTPTEMRARMEEQAKALDKARFELGDKAVALLDANQLRQWQRMLGRKFLFRPSLL